ncbi:MAG: Fic family protein [Egibacteraceae bacterium]
MDATQFSASDRGRVRRTLDGYAAFFPNPLPRKVELEHQTILRFEEATAALHRLAGVGLLLPDPSLLVAPYIRLEAVLSSRIEGTQTSVSELLQFEAAPTPDAASQDAVEVLNYVKALDHGVSRLRQGFPLSLRLIREVHERLLEGVRGQTQQPGEFRRSANRIGPPGCGLADATFVPPPIDEMHDALADLERFLHEDGLPLLIRLAMAHHQFEVIHPFLDGNGRVGRLLMSLMLVDRGVLEQPLLYLSVYFERHRSRYYELLLETSQTGDWTPWFDFFLDAVASQAKDAQARTLRLIGLQARTRQELLASTGNTTVVRLGELLLGKPVVTAASVARDLAVTPPTAQRAIGDLIERGVLEEITGRRTNRVYLAKEIMDSVYGEGRSRRVA